MGYFAVLAQPDDELIAQHLRASRLHVNIWALRGLWFGRRLFYFDVGVELRLAEDSPGGKSIRAVDFLLPFRVEEGRWPNGAPVAQDLYDVVISDHSGALIFGSPVHSSDASDGKSKIKFEDNELTVVRITEGGVAARPGHASAGSSVYTVPLRHPVGPGESVYFRLRWRIFGSSSMWKWARPESGARVDFRVCDTRQGIASQRDPVFIKRILPIDSANVFIMAPGRLAPTNVSPDPKHIRTLEPGAWTEYLKGASAWQWMARDLLVYGWHRRAGERPITEDEPLRIFLALNRPAGRPGWMNVGFAAMGFAVASWFLPLAGLVWRMSELGWGPLAAALGVGSVMGIWTMGQRVRPYFADRARKPREFFRRIERLLLCR